MSWVTDFQYRAAYQQCCGIISADAPSGLASSTAITPSFDGAIDFGPGIAAASFTGLATGTSGYVDTLASPAIDNFNEDWFTEDMTTTTADCLLFGISQVEPSTGNTATAPAAEIHDWLIEGTNRMTTEYRIVSSASTYRLEGLWAGTVSYSQALGVAYKIASAPAAPPANVAAREFNGGRFGPF